MTALSPPADDPLPPPGSVTDLLNRSRDDPAAWSALWRRLQAEVADVYARAIGRAAPHPHDDPRMADAVARIFLRPRVWRSRAS